MNKQKSITESLELLKNQVDYNNNAHKNGIELLEDQVDFNRNVYNEITTILENSELNNESKQKRSPNSFYNLLNDELFIKNKPIYEILIV